MGFSREGWFFFGWSIVFGLLLTLLDPQTPVVRVILFAVLDVSLILLLRESDWIKGKFEEWSIVAGVSSYQAPSNVRFYLVTLIVTLCVVGIGFVGWPPHKPELRVGQVQQLPPPSSIVPEVRGDSRPRASLGARNAQSTESNAPGARANFQPPPLPKSSKAFKSYSDERLNDTAKASLEALTECTVGFSQMDGSFSETAIRARESYQGVLSGNDETSKAKAKKDLEESAKRQKSEEEKASGWIRKRWTTETTDAYESYYEIADRLLPYERDSYFPDRQAEASFAKLKNGTYDLQDLRTAQQSLRVLQQLFEHLRGLGKN